MKRKLSETEKDLNEKAIKRFNDEIIDLSYILKDAKLKFDEGLDYSYRKQKKEYKELIGEIENKLQSNKSQIAILEDQNKNGVEPKINKATGG